jgi:hypothetical protein
LQAAAEANSTAGGDGPASSDAASPTVLIADVIGFICWFLGGSEQPARSSSSRRPHQIVDARAPLETVAYSGQYAAGDQLDDPRRGGRG